MARRFLGAILLLLMLLVAGCTRATTSGHPPKLSYRLYDDIFRPVEPGDVLTEYRYPDGTTKRPTLRIEYDATDEDGDLRAVFVNQGPRPGHMDLVSRLQNVSSIVLTLEGPHPSISIRASDAAGHDASSGVIQFRYRTVVGAGWILNTTRVEPDANRCTALLEGSWRETELGPFSEAVDFEASIYEGQAEMAVCRGDRALAYGKGPFTMSLGANQGQGDSEAYRLVVFSTGLQAQQVAVDYSVLYGLDET